MDFGSCSGHKQTAFSLLELLIVLAIVGMVLTVVPSMFGKGVSSAEMKSAARVLSAGLRSARSRALTQQVEVFLNIDVEKRQFEISDKKKIYVLPKGLDIKLTVVESERKDENNGAVRFYPDGSSTGGRIVVGYENRNYQIDIDWLTGDVAIAK